MPAEFGQDDFDWRTYNSAYRAQVNELEQQYTLRLRPGDYVFTVDGRLEKGSDVRPLHPNHRLLYETVLQLQPTSVVEVGCGAGDHLQNLAILAPSMTLHGIDRSDEQLRFLAERWPNSAAQLRQFDATLPFPQYLPRVDVAFTQAVLMHIQTGNGHLVALSNMFQMARRQVVLMENWSRHAFARDIRFLFDHEMIPWDGLHLYTRSVPEWGNQPHIVVASGFPLDYETLDDDRTLLDAMGAIAFRSSLRT